MKQHDAKPSGSRAERDLKRNENYFPLETNLINSIPFAKLIEAHGVKAYAIYLLILNELRISSDYRCAKSTIKALARKYKIRLPELERVLCDYNLFEITNEEDEEVVSSPYLDRVMEMYDKKKAQYAKSGKKRSDKSERDGNGRFTSDAPALDKTRLDNKKKTTVVVKKDGVDVGSKIGVFLGWEHHLNEAMNDEAWVELIAMRSGLSMRFMKHRAFVFETFRQHVKTQGSESRISSLSEAKAYIANYMRQGTVTQKHVAELISQREAEEQKNSPHRFEDVDPITGERTYFGCPIPRHAPPRPTANAVWNEVTNNWMR
ncbi:DUF4373 domain-containing protein [Bacteroides sp. 214]|uniref:DUF7833 domain-containing protein n=1 Tax=Bacteroides sp. 214 TaxID=2302935 RepID=UPI0013D4B91C|nr:Lin1244/Lin1753 domain-containing protein [Bacteroides sp. 214]NDW13430.1 DUF4373 domain-containing protein [Bacteroides sp. 214]